MAQLNKLQFTVQDNEGNPISGCSVSVRTQGAFVTSTQAGPTYTVDDPGGITTSHTVSPGILGTPVTTVTSVTATTVVTGGSGLGTMANNDRIVVETALPTLYADAQGVESKANPLTTDASGKAFAWVDLSKVDVIFTATGYATAIEYDRLCSGGEMMESNIFTAASAIAFRKWTSRTISTGGALLERWENPKATLKASIAYDGTIATQGNLTVAGTAAVTGATTLTGAVTMSSTASVAGLLTASNSFTYSGTAGNLTLTAGSVETADLADNCTYSTATGLGTADATLTAGAYATGNYVDLTGATVTFTPFSSDSEIVVIAQVLAVPAGAAAGILYGAIRNGAGTVLSEASLLSAAVAKAMAMSVMYRTTGLSGSQTFKLSAQCEDNNLLIKDSTNSAAGRVSRIIAMEFKK